MKTYKKIGRYYNVTFYQALYYYWVCYTKIRSKRDRLESRKFYELCKDHKKHGAERNSLAIKAWDGIGSPPFTFYPPPRWLKIWFY